MKLLESTENKINKNKNGENVPRLEITEVVLVHIFLKTFNWQFQAIEVYFTDFTDQNSQPLEIEDITNLTLVIK